MILEKTQNELEFPGEGKTPFDIILDLAPVSKPVRGSAGYFFWETKGGFNFRSIDSLIRQRPADQYTTDQEVPSYGAHLMLLHNYMRKLIILFRSLQRDGVVSL